MSTVRSLLKTIGQKEVLSIEPRAGVLDAIRKMRDHKIGALLVMEKGDFQGIVTERDYAWKVELDGRSAHETPVREIMTPASYVHTVTPFTTLEECLALMNSYHIRHLPVVENGKVVGIISIRDVVQGIVEHQIFLLQQFQGYISGRT